MIHNSGTIKKGVYKKLKWLGKSVTKRRETNEDTQEYDLKLKVKNDCKYAKTIWFFCMLIFFDKKGPDPQQFSNNGSNSH